MKENKFFEKFIENLPRLDEEKIRAFLEFVEYERKTYKQVLDSLDEAIFVLEENKFIFVNKQAQKILGVSNLKMPVGFDEAKKMVGNKEIIHYIALSINDEDYQTEWTLGGVEKRYFTVEKITGESGFFIVKITDITEKKNIEVQLKNMESISALNTLAAGIAHEIKNPLTAIDIHTQVLLKGIKKQIIDVPEEVTEYLHIVDEEQKRLNNIVNDFLTAARKRELKLSFEDINQWLSEIIALIKPEIEENHIELAIELEVIPKIFIDRDYLKQAMLNLLKNAIETMSEQDIKKKPFRRLTLKTFYSNGLDAVGIVISDTGGGIPKERIQTIFEPYFSTKESGTGLGLTIVYKIIKEHGGDIRVVSEVGKGSSFTIILPMNKGTKLLANYENGELK